MNMRGAELKKRTVDQFTAEAHSYDDTYKMVSGDYPEIVAELESEPFRNLLDCGCGTGAVLSLLHERCPDKELTGIDITPKMIDVAKSKALPNVEYVVGDCENLPFPDGSFDVVVCSHSFHHYPSPQDFFNSALRVLTPGGRLILRDNTGSILFLLKSNLYTLPKLRRRDKLGDVRFYSLRQVRRFCERAGLKVEKLEERATHKLHCVARKPL